MRLARHCSIDAIVVVMVVIDGEYLFWRPQNERRNSMIGRGYTSRDSFIASSIDLMGEICGFTTLIDI